MTARILVVDDVPANVKLLEVRLLAEYFEVLTATMRRPARTGCSTACGSSDSGLLATCSPSSEIVTVMTSAFVLSGWFVLMRRQVPSRPP